MGLLSEKDVLLKWFKSSGFKGTGFDVKTGVSICIELIFCHFHECVYNV